MSSAIRISNRPVQPGQYLGILGGGQLGRMFCHAAQSMGYKVAVLEPSSERQGSPAGMVADHEVIAEYDSHEGLDQLLGMTRAVTTEFENVPAESLKYLSYQARVFPSAAAVAVVQDRIAEKAFIASQGTPVAPYATIFTEADFEHLSDDLFPGILKVARLGYDGKGQARVKTREQAKQAYADFGHIPCVLEAMLDLHYEVSVILARGLDGSSICYPLGINTHINGILFSSVVIPGQIDPEIEAQAKHAALTLAEGLNYFGVMCVEFFILGDHRLIVNEIAPRPHNSGHYTMNACASSQFEQQVRVLAGMPLGSTELFAPSIMLNILGDSWFALNPLETQEPDWDRVLAIPGVSLHLYGKSEARIGRKMGHVNIVHRDPEQLKNIANQVCKILHLSCNDCF